MFLIASFECGGEGDQFWTELALFQSGDAFEYARERSKNENVVSVHPITREEYEKKEWRTPTLIFVNGIQYTLDAAQFKKEEADG